MTNLTWTSFKITHLKYTIIKYNLIGLNIRKNFDNFRAKYYNFD